MARKPSSLAFYATRLFSCLLMLLLYGIVGGHLAFFMPSPIGHSPTPTAPSYSDLPLFISPVELRVHWPSRPGYHSRTRNYHDVHPRFLHDLTGTAHLPSPSFETPSVEGGSVVRKRYQLKYTPRSPTLKFELSPSEVLSVYPIVRHLLSLRALSPSSFILVSTVHRRNTRPAYQVCIFHHWLPRCFVLVAIHRKIFLFHWHPQGRRTSRPRWT